MTQPAQQTDGEIERRMAHIETLMANRHSAYWKSPEMQSEYRELIRERQKRFPWETPTQQS